MSKDPIIALFGQYRRELLAVLLLRPDESFHTRELERLTGIPVGSLSRELKNLLEGGIVRREKQGNQVRYQADRSSPIFEDLAGLFRKTAGLVPALREALAPRLEDISLALVFGSVASSKARPGSDIDILLVGDVSLRDVVSLLSPLAATTGREINPVVMSPAQFRKAKAEQQRLLGRIKEEPKLFIKGDEGELG